MDAKEDMSELIQATLIHETDNYLYKYLTQREKQASFTEDRQIEHDGYSASLRNYKNHPLLEANAMIATRMFEKEKRSTAVSGFWKRIDRKQQQREEEKVAVRAASLGHLNFLGQTLQSVLGEQTNQEKGEDTAHDKDFERASATNESSVIIWEEISLTEQGVNKDEVLSGSSDASARPSSTKRQRDDNGEDREEQTSAEVDEEPEMINEMDYVPYIVDGIEIVAKLLEQKAVDNYEAAFYDILDLSEERGSDSIKSRFSPTVWKKLRSAARMEMVKMKDEVKAWLVAFDDKVLEDIHQELHRLSAHVLQTTPPLQNELRYVHRLYQNFADLWTQNPNQLLDKDMSEATQIIQAVSPMLKNLFQEKYQMKWGEIGLEASSIRRNQEVESSARRRPRQRTDIILSLRSHLGQELLVCEVSGAPYENDLEHFGDDKIKIQKGLKDMLNLVAKRAARGKSDIFQKLRVFGIQVFGWKAYIYAMDIPHKYLYHFEQVATFRIPQFPADLLWMPDTIHVLLSMKVWVNQAQENLEKLLRSSVCFSLEGNRTPPSSPMGYISKTLDTPHKPKKVKHPALA